MDAWTRVRMYAWTRQPPHFFSLFFLDKSRKLSKIVLVLQSASVERFDVSSMRDFYILNPETNQSTILISSPVDDPTPGTILSPRLEGLGGGALSADLIGSPEMPR